MKKQIFDNGWRDATDRDDWYSFPMSKRRAISEEDLKIEREVDKNEK